MTNKKTPNNKQKQDDALVQWLIDAEQILDENEDEYIKDKKLKNLYSYYKSDHEELDEMKEYLDQNPNSTIQDYIKVANHGDSNIIRLIKDWIFNKTNKGIF